MEIEEKYKKDVTILNNEIISEDSLEKLVENCCKVLSGQKETLGKMPQNIVFEETF